MRDASGRPNLDVIRAFGAYTQENLGAEVRRADAQTHLHGLFPDVVKPVADQNMAA
ncbi:hypothetical protein [Halocynthiibacter sp.]|uniref:hypothetical protein n=1 Tax=Halocynthiibacter sp. TaxID=1979210 RepID=UPI003C425388